MRVTNRMLANNFLTDMTTNLNNLQTLQQQLTSGKEIRRPSDDPLKVARAMQLHSEIGINKQYNENIKDTLSWLEQTDTALGQLGDQTHRIRELLVSAGNVAYGTDERKKINDEVKEIIGQMSQTLNASFDGRFIFGGTRGTAKPVNVIKGPMVTKPQKTSKSPDGSGDAKVTVTEKFDPKENTDYKIIINDATKGTVTFEKNGTDEKSIPTKIDKWELEDGISLEVDKGGNMSFIKDGETVTFNKTETNTEKNFKNGIKVNIDKTNFKITVTDKTGTAKVTDYTYTTSTTVPKTVKKDGTTVEIPKINKWELDNGIAFEMKEEKLVNGATYEFTALADGQKLVYADRFGKEIFDAEGIMGEKLVTEISQGVRVEYNITAVDVINFKDNKGKDRDLRKILEDIVTHLESDDAEDIKKITNEDLAALDAVMDNILKLRSQVGAKGNRMESALEKNKEENFNLTEILSKTEDIDLVEKTMEYAVAISVYMASLQTSARVLQPTLMDYVR
ncbi:flagellar hook-associated protein 3 FlgL [Clostridium cochlearium]|uniref:Flagellar hook-associated protein 3 FlgL n=1 Tax=Clostridium cochlearium TaxID=1494 RepID=A0ABY0QMR2_CLOCO|nr:flagellar hook-associated protein FlgL [Clostridium cochlearium]SDL29525.1 flagellar hook-associated protein 3 FlgL [Clostridium cochlearium]